MTELAARSSEHPAERPDVTHEHRDVTGGWLRPAVFGAMDGIVTNSSIVAGVAGAASAHTTAIAGVVGLVAGAVSMALGEWTSVTSQKELLDSEIANERAEIDARPAAEEAELAGLFRRRGLSADLARLVARELSRDHDEVWRVHIREELGIDPDDAPSPMLAAVSSFGSFAVGAIVPLLPYLFGAKNLLLSLILTAVGLVLLGGAVARFTGQPVVVRAVRQLVLGAAAVAVSYGVGRGLGSAISG